MTFSRLKFEREAIILWQRKPWSRNFFGKMAVNSEDTFTTVGILSNCEIFLIDVHIDWVYDRRQQSRLDSSVRRDQHLTHYHRFYFLFSQAQPWIVVSLVGIIVGINASVINIATEWVSDLRFGYCQTGWYLNQKFCCWAQESKNDDNA